MVCRSAGDFITATGVFGQWRCPRYPGSPGHEQGPLVGDHGLLSGRHAEFGSGRRWPHACIFYRLRNRSRFDPSHSRWDSAVWHSTDDRAVPLAVVRCG